MGTSKTASIQPNSGKQSFGVFNQSINFLSMAEPSTTRWSCFEQRERRWIALFLSCIIMFGLYYLIKLPASIHEQLRETLPDINYEQKYQLLYSLAQAPGVFIPIFVGTAVDTFGSQVCLLALSSTCLLGQIISSFGVKQQNWSITIAGRFVFGLGFEALFATNQAFLASWFPGREIGYALGVSSSASYLGFLSSFIVSPASANTISTSCSFWIGSIMMSISVLASAIAYRMDMPTGEASEVQSDPTCATAPPIQADEETNSNVSSFHNGNECQSICQMPTFPPKFWLICCSCLTIYVVDSAFIENASGLMLERNLFVTPPNDCNLKYPDKCSSGYLAPLTGNLPINYSNISCPESMRYITYAPPWPESIDVTSNESMQLGWEQSSYVFDSIKQADINCSDRFFSEACMKAYCEQKDQATEIAGLLMTIPYVVTICTSFIFGHYCVDKFGRPVELLCIAPIVSGIAHLLLLLERGPLIPALILEGIGYSIGVSALCPSVALVVDHSVGLAFGIYTSIQNLGLTLIPLIVASMYSVSGKYIPAVELLIVGTAALGLVFGMSIMYADKRAGSRLHA